LGRKKLRKRKTKRCCQVQSALVSFFDAEKSANGGKHIGERKYRTEGKLLSGQANENADEGEKGESVEGNYGTM